MSNLFKRFAGDESGAVTVDWVVITAAVVGLGIAVFSQVSGGVQGIAGDISGDMAARLNDPNATVTYTETQD